MVVAFACRCECVHFVLIALGKQGEILIYMLIEMSLVFCSASVWFPSLLICLSDHIITTHRIRLPAKVINFSNCPINDRLWNHLQWIITYSIITLLFLDSCEEHNYPHSSFPPSLP